jgi:phenylpropionate dioxygenase-like ring-hydroxylating dioxygenase large terminal subunit
MKFRQSRASNDPFREPFSLAAPQRMHRRRRRPRDIVQLYDASTSATTFEALEEDLDEMIGAWIPLFSASALKGLGPQRVQVMGLELAVWQANATGPWSVMTDACPHRLAPLSQGRVDPLTNCIECPYHGWQFDTNGTLKNVPQLEANRTLDMIKGGDATSLPVHQAGDMIFAFLPSSVHGEMFPQSLLPEDMYPTLREEISRNATYFTRDLPYSTDFLIENFMDPAHIPFAHHSLQSVRSDARDIPMRIYVSNFTHVEVFFEDESRGKKRECVWQYPLSCLKRHVLTNPSTHLTTLSL